MSKEDTHENVKHLDRHRLVKIDEKLS